MFVIDSKRANTMRLRLGKDASDIIKDDQFLPMFRSRQKQYPREFAESVKIAKRKRNPYNYLSTVWKKSNIPKTLEWLGKILDRIIHNVAENFDQIDINPVQINHAGRQKILDMYRKHNLFRM